jgi:DNA-binding FadR family transcriptional regulator
MPKTAAQRMSAYRSRQRASGLTTLSLLVPQDDVALFREFAAERRNQNVPVLNTASRHNPRVTGRRAEVLADELLKHVIRIGWPVGNQLGSEGELMQQFGVSRPVLRQAIRLLEHYGVARVQRGVAGGLVVDAPDASATARAVSIYLEFRRIRPTDILETRKILEQATISLAVQRLTREGETRLRNDIAAEAALDCTADPQSWQRLHFTIADLSGDPALSLFAGIILRLSETHSNFSRRPRVERGKVVARVKKLHLGIAEAMISRNAAMACRSVERYLDGYKEWMD